MDILWWSSYGECKATASDNQSYVVECAVVLFVFVSTKFYWTRLLNSWRCCRRNRCSFESRAASWWRQTRRWPPNWAPLHSRISCCGSCPTCCWPYTCWARNPTHIRSGNRIYVSFSRRIHVLDRSIKERTWAGLQGRTEAAGVSSHRGRRDALLRRMPTIPDLHDLWLSRSAPQCV